MEKVISAISTASGVGGVAIIRLSGDGALDICEKMFTPISKSVKVKDFEPYKLYVGEINGGNFTDFGMAVYFKAPKSYTGEDMVEFHCHGGIAITRGILKQTLLLGAEPATRGEFTKRAFINGKLSLDSAEGLIDMINSESVAGVKVGYSLYREKLFNKINELQDKLTYALASIDANIDYPEEDLEETALDTVESALKTTLEEVKCLISKYNEGSKLKNGITVAIVGKPNTGKSSILNSLLNYEKAIVSDVEGTTRDVVEGSIDINGVRFNFYDTAGIHETKDSIEKLGIERSEKILKNADIVLLVLDLSREITDIDVALQKEVEGKEVITVYNKSDLKTKENCFCISAKTGEGINLLKEALYNKAFNNGIDFNAEYITEERHYNALIKAEKHLNEALFNINKVPLELITEDIKNVWLCLGEITGKTASEDIIEQIFLKFCVGK